MTFKALPAIVTNAVTVDILRELSCHLHVASSLQSIVLMLGLIRTFMNILGVIGTLMEGSGLREIVQELNGENAYVIC